MSGLDRSRRADAPNRPVHTSSAGGDALGLRRAFSNRLLPVLVAAMSFLCALSLGAMSGGEVLARHWQMGAGAALMVQMHEPAQVTPEQLAAVGGIESVRELSSAEIAALLRPWLGADPSNLGLKLGQAFDVKLRDGAARDAVASALEARFPAALIEQNGAWLVQLQKLARSVRTASWLALSMMMSIALLVVVIATRAGLASRREALLIIHGLGAADPFIARRFAVRVALLCFAGSVLGTLAALPPLVAFASLASPLVGQSLMLENSAQMAAALPQSLLVSLLLLPLVMALIGFVSANLTVRLWLGRLV